ncbi:universal stress protein [Bradyrhizobium sp. LMTR 3]|uniref:universal stress protein n=1 Tax=Bradyrhizobium sp. LMTR 3 TaxID=189873 RepID=UPI000810BFC0|nr:universal stress protein [Bradyrhizobium sp. LMTR 3]OCK54149.1 universal stress protein UspA [Bradyrhizobium sp. LMTR 3]
MHKLLIPVDGSANASRALAYALKFAKEIGPVELHLLTVHPEPVIYGEIQVYVSKEKMEELQRKHSEDILRPAIEAARAADVSYTSDILIGDTAPMIIKRADELNCDGIVMGTRGMGAIGNLVMGSVATKVVHLTTVPVTLVK